MVAVFGADRIYTVIRRDARRKRVIIDHFNDIASYNRIDCDVTADRARYTVSEGGVVAMPRGSDTPDLTRYQI